MTGDEAFAISACIRIIGIGRTKPLACTFTSRTPITRVFADAATMRVLIDKVRSIAAAHGAADKPIAITEENLSWEWDPTKSMSPILPSSFEAGLWVADAVYSPLWTPLLTAAKAKGAEVMTGRELAIYQAADAFELFTGLKPSIVEIGNAFDAVMARRYSMTA